MDRMASSSNEIVELGELHDDCVPVVLVKWTLVQELVKEVSL